MGVSTKWDSGGWSKEKKPITAVYASMSWNLNRQLYNISQTWEIKGRDPHSPHWVVRSCSSFSLSLSHFLYLVLSLTCHCNNTTPTWYLNVTITTTNSNNKENDCPFHSIIPISNLTHSFGLHHGHCSTHAFSTTTQSKNFTFFSSLYTSQTIIHYWSKAWIDKSYQQHASWREAIKDTHLIFHSCLVKTRRHCSWFTVTHV